MHQVFSQQVSGFVPTDAYRAQVAQKSPALAPLINAYPEGKHSYRRSERAAVDQQRTQSHQRRRRTVSHRLCHEQRRPPSAFASIRTATERAPSALAENTFTTMDPPNAVLDVQHSFSPTILNDARIGFNRDNYVDVGDGTTPYSVSITGFAGYSLGDHSSRIDNSYSFVDNATFSHGPPHHQGGRGDPAHAGEQGPPDCRRRA